MTPHPLDPITSREILAAVDILKQHHPGRPIRFKVVDLYEPEKASLVPYLESERLGTSLPPRPDRKARAYYHTLDDKSFYRSIVNLSTSALDSCSPRNDIQGPADSDEQIEMENICMEHPVVLQEIAKLKLPPE